MGGPGDIWQEISWWLVGDGWRYMAGDIMVVSG